VKISRHPSLVQLTIDKKRPENVEYFNYLDITITNHARCTREIKTGIVMTKEAFNRKKALFTTKLDLILRRKPVDFYTRIVPVYGAKTWTLRKVNQKHLESFEMWWWRRMEAIS
jgi:hypothetical protein